MQSTRVCVENNILFSLVVLSNGSTKDCHHLNARTVQSRPRSGAKKGQKIFCGYPDIELAFDSSVSSSLHPSVSLDDRANSAERLYLGEIKPSGSFPYSMSREPKNAPLPSL